MSEPIEQYDERGNLIYYRDSGGCEEWSEYDENGACTHYRNSDGYECWYEYDENGAWVYYRDNGGREWGTPRTAPTTTNPMTDLEEVPNDDFIATVPPSSRPRTLTERLQDLERTVEMLGDRLQELEAKNDGTH